MLFNGSAGNESFEASANGGRVRFTRNVGEHRHGPRRRRDARHEGPRRRRHRSTVNDLSGTDVTDVVADLNAAGGGDDLAADNVIVNVTNGDDVVAVAGTGANVSVTGLAARVAISGAHRRQRPR